MIGSVLAGKYRIQSLIGSGGMANVYKGVCLQSRRIVAIKILKEEFAGNAEFIRRFKREAQAVLSLSHENIVKSIDVGEENGTNFIVLEYVEGETLKELIQRQGKIDPKQAVMIACQILDGLMHAHDRGIVHRDIKPQNILLNYRGKPKIADFGIARDAEASTVTFTGNSIMGSVHYLSPEQARGEQVGPESDIYSTGIMLYEMVTGKMPFSGDSSVSVALKHLQEDIVPPIELNPELPRSLNDIIIKATSKNAKERYSSAHAMKTDLLRSLREPEGNFVFLNKKKEKEPEPARQRLSMIPKIGFGIILAIGIFIVMFYLGKTILQNDREVTGNELVPKLVNKTLEEAEEIANARGYQIIVSETVASESVPDDTVISQDPEEGTTGRADKIIKVVLSGGSVKKTMPNLVNLSLIKATQALETVGLRPDSVKYETSDKPVGYVFKQEPAQGQTIYEGDKITIWVSGDEKNTNIVPSVTKTNIQAALISIQKLGFEKILIRYVKPSVQTAENTVTKQEPVANELYPVNMPIQLWVSKTIAGEYTSDIAFNLEISKNDTQVLITMLESAGVETVVYENKLSKGMQPISITVNSVSSTAKQLIVYIEDQEVRRESVKFKKPNS